MARPQSSTSKLILSMPTTMTAAEVVKAVKAKGMKTTESNVYRVRRLGKKKAGRPAAGATAVAPVSAAPRRRGRPPKVASAASSGAEDLLRAVAAEVGLARSIEVLQGERARVGRLIGG
jgi:hypothetical protein